MPRLSFQDRFAWITRVGSKPVNPWIVYSWMLNRLATKAYIGCYFYFVRVLKPKLQRYGLVITTEVRNMELKTMYCDRSYQRRSYVHIQNRIWWRNCPSQLNRLDNVMISVWYHIQNKSLEFFHFESSLALSDNL